MKQKDDYLKRWAQRDEEKRGKCSGCFWTQNRGIVTLERHRGFYRDEILSSTKMKFLVLQRITSADRSGCLNKK